MLVVDMTGIIRYANKPAENIFGRTFSQLIGETFGHFIPAGEVTEIDIVGNGAEAGIGEMSVVETMWDGEKAQLISIRDITKHKKLEQTLKNEIAGL